MRKINIDGLTSNWEVPVNICEEVVENKTKRFLKEWYLWSVIWIITVLFITWFILSTSAEDKQLIRLKQLKQSNDIRIQKDFNTIKVIQEDIERIKKENEKIDWQLHKIINKYNPLGWLLPKTYADEEQINDILDNKIKKFCWLHKLADELYFEEDMKTRCTLILQAIYRFETWNLKSYTWNNIFNFRSPWLKSNREEKYKITWIKWWFLIFEDKTNCIKFAVDRFYKYDRYKTISQVISWWCYISPVDNKKKCFQWYTFTEWHQKNYTFFVKEYYKNNL